MGINSLTSIEELKKMLDYIVELKAQLNSSDRNIQEDNIGVEELECLKRKREEVMT